MTQLSEKDLSKLLESARRFALIARQQLQQEVSKGIAIKLKQDESEVTSADQAIEAVLRQEIGSEFPDHQILGEELAAKEAISEFQWIIDPIDGTQNFIRGIPTFGIIIGLHFRKKPIVGVICHPLLNLTYSAAQGLGSYENDQRIKLAPISQKTELKHELIALSTVANFSRNGDTELFNKIVSKHQNIRIYGDCFSHTRAISGNVSATLSYNVRPWDVAATQILIEEAGGKYLTIKESAEQIPLLGVLFGKAEMVDYIQSII